MSSLLALLVLLPYEASAQDVISPTVDAAVLATGATLANLAGVLPAVGAGIGVAYETPNKRWAIAGVAIGGAQMTVGALSLASGLAEEKSVWLAAYGGATALLGVGNLVLGLINLFQSQRAQRQIDLLDAPYWSVAPVDMGRGAVGLGLAIGGRSRANEAWPDSGFIE